MVKSDGSGEPFDREKIASGVRAAVKGRAVDDSAHRAVGDRRRGRDQVGRWRGELASRIGLAVLDRLRLLDEVAYLRFASVYKNFDAAADFQSELELLEQAGAEPAERVATCRSANNAVVSPAVPDPSAEQEAVVVGQEVGEVVVADRPRRHRRSSRGPSPPTSRGEIVRSSSSIRSASSSAPLQHAAALGLHVPHVGHDLVEAGERAGEIDVVGARSQHVDLRLVDRRLFGGDQESGTAA